MANKIEILVVLGLLLSGGIAFIGNIDQSNPVGSYYCESRAIIINCDKLSSGIGTRCYYEDTYKKCNEGWVLIEEELDLPTNQTINIGRKYLCNTEECTLIE